MRCQVCVLRCELSLQPDQYVNPPELHAFFSVILLFSPYSGHLDPVTADSYHQESFFGAQTESHTIHPIRTRISVSSPSILNSISITSEVGSVSASETDAGGFLGSIFELTGTCLGIK